MIHGPLCPYVKALEFDGTGAIVRVEFLTPADFGTRTIEDGDGTKVSQPDYPRLQPGWKLPDSTTGC